MRRSILVMIVSAATLLTACSHEEKKPADGEYRHDASESVAIVPLYIGSDSIVHLKKDTATGVTIKVTERNDSIIWENLGNIK